MPHPIYGDPKHILEEVTVKLWLPTHKRDGVTKVHMYGHASTQRRALWREIDEWTPDEGRGGYGPSDLIHHAVLCALQDHPTSQEQYEACLRGEGWAQDELPY